MGNRSSASSHGHVVISCDENSIIAGYVQYMIESHFCSANAPPLDFAFMPPTDDQKRYEKQWKLYDAIRRHLLMKGGRNGKFTINVDGADRTIEVFETKRACIVLALVQPAQTDDRDAYEGEHPPL